MIVRGQGNGQEGEDGRKTDEGRGIGESGEKRADMSLFNSHRVSAAELHLIQTVKTVLSPERVRSYNLPS